MSDCIDILRSISATCASINQIGGVDKRAWVTQLNQIESYTFDSNGYVNSLVTREIGTTNYRYELAQIIGKKNTHSGNYEGVVGENVSLVKQNAILKIYTDSPSDRDKVVELFDAQELVVFFENSNGKIEVFGLDKGLEGSALVGGTGTEMQDDTAVTITLTGDQNKLPYYFLYGGSLATSIEYLDSVGLNPISVIEGYSFGESEITFEPDGSDGWNVTALLEPTSFTNIPDGLTVDSTHFDIEFWSSGLQTTIFDNTIATDQTENTGANGAGVYYVAVTYNFSDGTAFVVYGYYLVDATDTILKSVVISGVTVNSVTGLVMDIEANVVQTNCNIPYVWIGIKTDNSPYVLGTGDSGTFTLQPTTNKIVFRPLLEDDTDFNDYSGDPTVIQTIIIS